jgi:hypothetical protein
MIIFYFRLVNEIIVFNFKDLVGFYEEFDAQMCFYLVSKLVRKLGDLQKDGLYFVQMNPQNLYVDLNTMDIKFIYSNVD